MTKDFPFEINFSITSPEIEIGICEWSFYCLYSEALNRLRLQLNIDYKTKSPEVVKKVNKYIEDFLYWLKKTAYTFIEEGIDPEKILLRFEVELQMCNKIIDRYKKFPNIYYCDFEQLYREVRRALIVRYRYQQGELNYESYSKILGDLFFKMDCLNQSLIETLRCEEELRKSYAQKKK